MRRAITAAARLSSGSTSPFAPGRRWRRRRRGRSPAACGWAGGGAGRDARCASTSPRVIRPRGPSRDSASDDAVRRRRRVAPAASPEPSVGRPQRRTRAPLPGRHLDAARGGGHAVARGVGRPPTRRRRGASPLAERAIERADRHRRPSVGNDLNVPAASAAYVIVALSVSISTSSSPSSTWSPSSHEPREDRALLHRVGELGHGDFGHTCASMRSRAAPTIVSASMPKWR